MARAPPPWRSLLLLLSLAGWPLRAGASPLTFSGSVPLDIDLASIFDDGLSLLSLRTGITGKASSASSLESSSASSSSGRRSHAAPFPAPAAPARSALEVPVGANFVFEDHPPGGRRDRQSGDQSSRLSGEAPSPALLAGAVCVQPDPRSAKLALKRSVIAWTPERGSGLPPWPRSGAGREGGDKAAAEEAAALPEEPLRIAYLIQVCQQAKLPLVRRVFRKLYSEDDTFLYLVDSQMLNASLVEAALSDGARPEASLPSNVAVQPAPHAGYFYWPRVKVVLDGIDSLLESPRHWDFVVHLSESDYPVHSQSWFRSTLARQRDSNFIRVMPRCMRGSRPVESSPSFLLDQGEPRAGAPPTTRRGSDRAIDDLSPAVTGAADTLGSAVARPPPPPRQGDHEDASLFELDAADAELDDGGGGGDGGGREETDGSAVEDLDDWYWWKQTRAIASCGDSFAPTEVPGVKFPLQGLEKRGLIFARSPEWVVLTRELASYATGPGIETFQRLIGMHAGADEIYWATLVMNIPNFTQKLSKQGWYVKWPRDGSGHSPDTITEEHLPELLQHRDLYLFTRKVDEDGSRSVLQALDEAARDEEDGVREDRAPTSPEASSALEVKVSFELTLDRSQARCF